VAVVQHKPQMMTITVDGEEAVTDYLFTMNIGNGPFSGGGIRQNPDADPQDGIFHAMFLRKPTFGQIMQALPRLFNGKLADLDFVHPLIGKEIEVNYKKHIMFEADGILENITGPCKVTCIHHAIQMQV
jgi:diacylglycerol kinase (ATP)